MDSGNSRRGTSRGDISPNWDNYWRGSAESGAWDVGGARHPAFAAFWADAFATAGQAANSVSLLDIASGDGAVLAHAQRVLGDARLNAHCVDASPAAIEGIAARFPNVQGLVCDALDIPLESRSFDIVSSQFGLEYAGEGAAAEAIRLVADGGRLVLLLHHADGLLARESSEALQAVERLRSTEFIPLARKMFSAGFAAVRGADRAPYDAAAARLAPAASEIEEIIGQHGEAVAGGTVASLYAGVAGIHAKLPNYDPSEVEGWLSQLQDELEPFAGRLTEMLDCALDLQGLERFCRELQEAGGQLQQVGPLQAPDSELPLAWAVLASR